MRYTVGLIALSLLLAFTVDGQTRRGRARNPQPKPKVGYKVVVPPPPAEPTSVGLTVEKYVSNYDLNGDGTGRQTWEMHQRCHIESCLPRASSIKRVYNGDLEKFKLLEAYILKPDGTKVALPPSAHSDRTTDQTEAAPGFSSLREFEIRFDGFAVGDVACLKLEIVTFRSNFEGRFDALEIFPILFDWKQLEVNVTAPANYPLYVEGVSLDGGKLEDVEGRSRWQFRKANISKINLEPMMHDVVSASPRFALTNFKNFEELGAAYWQSMQQKAVVTPQIKALADEITKDVTDPSQQASLIYEWVNKNIRYLSVVLDRGGWVPHSASEIIANRYGDCKDYSTVIHTLLKAKNIDSTPVLIRSDLSDWFPGVATADYFNHAVLYIPSIDLFADATVPNTRLGLVPQLIVGKKAVLAGERTGLTRVPDNDPAANQLISSVDLELQPNGDLKARTRNTYVGRSEILFRPMFADSSFRSNSAQFVKMLLAYHGVQGDGTVLNIGNPHKVGEPFSVDIEAKIADYTTFLQTGKVAIPHGISMVNMRALEMFISTEKRRTNLMVGATTFRETYTVSLPSQVQPVAPAASEFSNSIGKFKVASELKDRKVIVTRELILHRDIVRPSDYPAFKELVEKMLGLHEVEISYSADPSLLRDKSKQLRTAARTPPVRSAKSLDPLEALDLPRKLRPVEVQRLEAKLKTDENDVETRMLLLRHYYWNAPVKTPAINATVLRHRLWLIQNRPDITDSLLYGYTRPEYDAKSSEFQQLKAAWIERVNADKKNVDVRIAAVEFIRDRDNVTAELLLREAIEADPDNYKLPLLLADILAGEFHASSTPPARRLELSKRLIELGNAALTLISKERSDERDADRGQLLKTLSYAALETGDLNAAGTYAKELVLDFGQSSNDFVYDEMTHVGNTVMGLVELRRNNIEKAKEHLLTSIKAPLRKDYNSLTRIETRLAKEIYDKGEKIAVTEYLRLCLELGNLKEYPESYADEIKSLKLWQEQISKGIRPSFEFPARK